MFKMLLLLKRWVIYTPHFLYKVCSFASSAIVWGKHHKTLCKRQSHFLATISLYDIFWCALTWSFLIACPCDSSALIVALIGQRRLLPIRFESLRIRNTISIMCSQLYFLFNLFEVDFISKYNTNRNIIMASLRKQTFNTKSPFRFRSYIFILNYYSPSLTTLLLLEQLSASTE